MRYKSVGGLYHGFEAKSSHGNLKTLITSGNHMNLVVIKLSSKSWLLKLMSRVIIFAMLILIIEVTISRNHHQGEATIIKGFSNNNDDEIPLLFHDLANEGLLKLGNKAIFVSDGNERSPTHESQLINKYGMDVIHISEIEQRRSNNILDFIFVYNYDALASSFINESLKIGGIVVIQLSNTLSTDFKKPSNYKLVYIRKFNTTFMAMRKTAHDDDDDDMHSLATQRKLLSGLSTTKTEAKRAAALQNLEDVLLEPPRASSGKSRIRYMKHTRYLPDLMGDSLESYPRRVFIDVGLHDKKSSRWFLKHYPTRKQKFEMYKIDTVAVESSKSEEPQTGMSDWLKKNVKENEYVVMKAEDEVVEEMVKSKAIRLVDELFLECKHEGIKRGKNNKSRRAYWECLTLYGILKDEGIAVHQWWG